MKMDSYSCFQKVVGHYAILPLPVPRPMIFELTTSNEFLDALFNVEFISLLNAYKLLQWLWYLIIYSLKDLKKRKGLKYKSISEFKTLYNMPVLHSENS